ncbi:DNA polymerase [Synechococcus phage S-PM2]|uniref:DNA-directed DNA polymerase n=1 Tax=Synechococcus phage S-PM2 TaxID=238854 RepID=Q5GQK4_BPSYP|nr:DNA polymerase [Synechococcus phage S-PM2]CAF34198.1 DNA polymerase [Synechococcus phage S-PM2]CFW42316.1 DNA polymerase [Synechococcus phage S-PM2]
MKFYTSVQQAGNFIHVRGYENGIQFNDKVQFNPTLFLPTNQPSRWKTLDGKNVRPVKQGTIRDAKKFVEEHKEIPDFEICGQTRYLNQYISEEYPDDEIKFDSSLIRVFTLDIETAAENGFPDIETADQEILLISLKDSKTNRITVFGRYAFDNKHKDVDYMHFGTEVGMLNAFLHFWTSNYPDVITGWNVQLFDMTYISRRIERVIGEKEAKLLSPWKSTLAREIYIKGRKQIAYDISGVATLDYLELYKKFTYTNQESYRLDHIASVELGTKKLDHSEYDTFKEFYTKDWQKFVEYNIIDVRLVDQLDDKMKLLELAFTMAYDAKVNYEDVFSQVRMWDNYIYIELLKNKIAIPPKKEARKDAKYAGAYVKEPKPGFYDWVVSFDLNSLYPHLIMQYNLSPETLLSHRHPTANVDRLLNKELDLSNLDGQSLAANGTFYDNSKQGFLPKMMQKMYDERVVYKNKMLAAKQKYEENPTIELKKEIARCNNIQMAKKISLNSAYGAIGNEHFRYFRLEIAEAITLSGQLSIRWIENKMNEYLNKLLKTDGEDYVIASDTDSIYLNLGPLVEKIYSNREKDDESIVNFLDKVCKMELEKYIESSYKELAIYMNAYQQKMQMKRENIANRGIWTAKKRYILNVWDSEGVRYKEPKMKIMGLETARSSTPSYYRDKLYQAFKIILIKTNDDLIDFIEFVKADTRTQDYVNIAFPRGCNGLDKYKSVHDIYKKGTPIQVRGALLYNYYVRKNKLTNKYPIIQEGEKIKFIYLRTPNPIQENCISFFSDIPKEFNVDKYIDYQTQFEKSFLEPLKNVLECIGWDYEKKVSLLSFF